MIDAGLAPHSGGTPLHVKTLEDENYYVVGTLTFRLGERTLDEPAGTFFADLAELMASMPPGPPDMSRMAAVYEKYGLRVVGPPPSSDR